MAEFHMHNPSPDNSQSTRYPVSVKGVLIHENNVLLLKNERDEWELPGGKLELYETPEDCVVREIEEETGLRIVAGQIMRPYVFYISNVTPVLILPFHCHCKNFDAIRISHEHKEIGTFDVHRLDQLKLPPGYRNTILAALELEDTTPQP
ncbi:NUDIX hydrolase [Oxalobacteraceae bacterium CAVE-383]|nr:NUDIX hydrolase [Oxalobacteraceae bacterium CAVE-383]